MEYEYGNSYVYFEETSHFYWNAVAIVKRKVDLSIEIVLNPGRFCLPHTPEAAPSPFSIFGSALKPPGQLSLSLFAACEHSYIYSECVIGRAGVWHMAQANCRG
jgi:hypothetical protein